MDMGRLTALELSEISVVAHPANRRRFLVLKQHHPMKGGTKMPEQQLTKEEAEALETALCTPLANEDELLQALGELAPEKLAIAKGLLRLSAHTGLAADAQRDLFARAGIGFPKPLQKSDPKPDPKPAPLIDPEPKPATSLTKAEVDAELKKRDDTIEKQAAEITRLTKSEAERTAAEDARAVAELVAKHGTPGDRENLTKLVKSMTPEQRAMWASSQEGARKAYDLMLKQVGRAGGGSPAPESAQAKIQALIQSAVMKAGDKADMDTILRSISQEHPDLFEDARAEAVGG